MDSLMDSRDLREETTDHQRKSRVWFRFQLALKRKKSIKMIAAWCSAKSLKLMLSKDGIEYQAYAQASVSAAKVGRVSNLNSLLQTLADPTMRRQLCFLAAKSAARFGQLNVVQQMMLEVEEEHVDDLFREIANTSAKFRQWNISVFLAKSAVELDANRKQGADGQPFNSKYTRLSIVKLPISSDKDAVEDDFCMTVPEAEIGHQFSSRKALEFLLLSIPDGKVKDLCGVEAAKVAAEKRQWDILKFLLKVVADQRARDECCLQSVRFSAACCEWDVANFLLHFTESKIKQEAICEVMINTALEFSSREVIRLFNQIVVDGSVQFQCCLNDQTAGTQCQESYILEILLSKISLQKLMEKCCAEGSKAAAKLGHLRVLETLIGKITDPKLIENCLVQSTNAAASEGHWNAIDFLVKSAQDQKVKDECCMKAAWSAGRFGKCQLLEDLIQCIYDERLREQCCIQTSIFAASERQWEAAKLLLQEVSDPTSKAQCCMEIALSAAEFNERASLVEIIQLIDFADIKEQCCIKTANYVATRGQLEEMRFLVNCIDDLKSKDDCCFVATKSAALAGQIEVIKYLVSTFVDQAVRNKCCVEAAIDAAGAASVGQVDVIRHLIQSITDQTLRNQCCKDASKFAALAGKWDFVKFFIFSIGDPNLRDQSCIEPAKAAVIEGNFEMLKLLVQAVGNQCVRDQCCMEAAIAAVIQSRQDIVKFLVQTIAEQRVRDQCCMKAVLEAVRNQQLMKYLFQSICDSSIRDRSCLEAVKAATSAGLWDIVKFLVEIVDDSSMRDQCYFEAAKSAAKAGQLDLLRSLSKRRLRIDFRRECAIAACSSLQEDIVVFLGLEPDWLFQSSQVLNFTASMAIEGRNSVLTQTLSRMQPAQLTQLLCVSISHGYVALALTLMNDERFSREHVDLPDGTGATALMLAADAGHHELIDKLLDLGASVRAEDSQGRTALSRACEGGHLRAAKTLMDGGADASHRDSRGLTLSQLAEQAGHSQMLRMLNERERKISAEDVAVSSGVERFQDNIQEDRQLSEELYQLLCEAGFTQERARCQQKMAFLLEGIARSLTNSDMQMTGSYSDGWANSLMQVNGRTAADSDIDWTVLTDGQEFHLDGSCNCRGASKLRVTNGHAQVAVGSGNQPTVTTAACGIRPAFDICRAIPCCSPFCHDRVEKLCSYQDTKVHLVRATRPNCSNELRVSFSFHEKHIMKSLSTVQGQLFTIIKFIFKRHLPLELRAPGLKSYHAKTLLFFMLEKHGTFNNEEWQPQNLKKLLKESIDLMLGFMDSSESPDECMPHFFMRDASIYFKNAGIGGDFDNTKSIIQHRLSDLRSHISKVKTEISRWLRPLQLESFYYHPFTLLPLKVVPSAEFISKQPQKIELKFCLGYTAICQTLTELQSESSRRDCFVNLLSMLSDLNWCRCANLCLNVMVQLKCKETLDAEKLLLQLQNHHVQRAFLPHDFRSTHGTLEILNTGADWAWRFCFPHDTPPRFTFLPEFTQTLLTARLSQPRSSHLYVNFRCLSWSLQAELLRNRTAIDFDAWLSELQEDPDLEELLTLAHYSDRREHVEFSLRQMVILRDERRVAMETQDFEKIRWVREKLWRVSNRRGSDSGIHPSAENEERKLWTRARLWWTAADFGRLVAMETIEEQRAAWISTRQQRFAHARGGGRKLFQVPVKVIGRGKKRQKDAKSQTIRGCGLITDESHITKDTSVSEYQASYRKK